MFHRFRGLAPAALLAISACGTLFNGGPANVAFNSNPSGATILIDGAERGTTPATLALAKNRSYNVTFRLPGHQDATTEITRKMAGGYLILDILGGLVPVIVDAATGGWYVLGTNNVSMNLTQQQASIESQGQLAPAELAAVRLGAPISHVLTAAEITAGRTDRQ